MTGGGILGNLARVLPAGLRAEIDWGRLGTATRVRLARAARRRGRAPARVQPRNRVPRRRARSRRRARDRTDRPGVIGVLVSGEGTNLQALLDAGLPVVAVASNVAGARALERADAAGVASATFALDDYADRDARDAAMADWLVEHGVELVVCAGYMHLLRAGVPRPLPAAGRERPSGAAARLPGAHPLEDVLAAGAPAAAATVHYVDEGVDTGEVIASRGRSRPRRGHRRDAARARARGRASAASEGGARAVRALISVYDKTGLVRLRARPGRARLRARRERRHGRGPRGGGTRRDTRRGRHGLPGDARRAREDAPPARSTPGSSPDASVPDDLAALAEHGIELVRPRVREPLSVRARGRPSGARRGRASSR